MALFFRNVYTTCMYQTTRCQVSGDNVYRFMALENNFREGITKCSNEVYNKTTDIHHQNKYLLEYLGYMFRHINKSSSGHR